MSKDIRKRTTFNNDFYNCQSDLTEEEYKNFGDRFPSSFLKIGLLGRGGFSLVWLGVQKKSKRRVAIKQILSKNPHQTHLK
jgi:serine/threonine protein kinase